MNVVQPEPWTAERFLVWAEGREERYEFDGVRPVAMTGGTPNHDAVTGSINMALRARLRGTPCSSHGPTLGLHTSGAAIRYPDALITCTKFPGTDRPAPDVRIILEVVSPASGGLDRIVKVREYASFASVRRYIIAESTTAGLQVLHRASGEAPWAALALTGEDVLALPEVGLEIPVAEFYEGVVF